MNINNPNLCCDVPDTHTCTHMHAVTRVHSHPHSHTHPCHLHTQAVTHTHTHPYTQAHSHPHAYTQTVARVQTHTDRSIFPFGHQGCLWLIGILLMAT